MMRLIGYKAYRRGFIGCLSDREAYVYFIFSSGTLKVIQRYPREHFESDEHFAISLHKFVPRRFFLRRSQPLASLEGDALTSVRHRLECSPGADAFLTIADRFPADLPESMPSEAAGHE